MAKIKHTKRKIAGETSTKRKTTVASNKSASPAKNKEQITGHKIKKIGSKLKKKSHARRRIIPKQNSSEPSLESALKPILTNVSLLPLTRQRVSVNDNKTRMCNKSPRTTKSDIVYASDSQAQHTCSESTHEHHNNAELYSKGKVKRCSKSNSSKRTDQICSDISRNKATSKSQSSRKGLTDYSEDSEVSEASCSEIVRTQIANASHHQTQHSSHSKSTGNPYIFDTNYDSSDDLGISGQIEMKKCKLTGKRLASCKTIDSKTRQFTDSLIDLGVGFVLNKYSRRRHYKDVEKVMRQVQARLQKNLDVLKAPESDVQYEKLQDELVTAKEEWERLHNTETRLTEAVEEEEERVMEDDTSSQDDRIPQRPGLKKVNPLLKEKYEEELCLPNFY